jgi:hypothetical protein
MEDPHSSEESKAIGPMSAISKLLRRGDKATGKGSVLPVADRGVQVAWLLKFGQAINPGLYEGADLTTKDVVNRVVVPLTESEHVPLYARIPDEFRGPPRHFLSHAWDDYFRRPFGFGLASVLEYRFRPHDCVWIDFVCHNQHEVEQLPEQLQSTIERIGSVHFIVTEPIIFTRSWCIYELLHGHLVNANMRLQVAGGHPTDHIFKAEQAIKQFTSIRNAQATKEDDKRRIDGEIRRAFGRMEDADTLVRTLMSQYQDELRHRYSSKA